MQHESIYRYYPLFLIAILVEVWVTRRSQKPYYFWRESLASLGIAFGHRLSNALFKVIPTSALFLGWQYRLFTVPMDRWWSIPLLFMAIEFFYYWYHRSAHKIRWLWATHAIHHSSQYFNLSAAYRLGWTNWLSGNAIFFIPLSWLGFPPIAVGTGLSLNLVYQFWIHTELIPKLGVLEWAFNTPSHHRVHHASNPEYIDRNFGGVLILFDRLFGTFAEQNPDRALKYGLTHPLRSYNPFVIVFYEWHRIYKDWVRAKTWGDRYRIILGPPA
jgi:sterol desaturase/sphingolipid hydroxylase (fatty acid hydroxylase superfamily)